MSSLQDELIIPISELVELSKSKANHLQEELSKLVVESKIKLSTIRFIAGVDVYYDVAKANVAIIILDLHENSIKFTAIQKTSEFGPYIPGYFVIRELPCIVYLWNKLSGKIKNKIDLVLVDGHGICHPRHCGLATHLSFYLNKSTIGIAKSPLYGSFQTPVNVQGATQTIYDETSPEKIIGKVIRSKVDTQPIYVSIGNWVSLDSSYDIVMKLLSLSNHRIPNPLWGADRLSRNMGVEL